MNEQCQLTKTAPLLREDPYFTLPTPEIFCKNPPFRSDLVFAPNEREWQKIAADMKICDGCIIHPKDRISFKNKKYQIKRLFYEWFVSSLGEEFELRSTCGNTKCIYPGHLHTRKRASYADQVFQMWKNRFNDEKLTQKQRAEKYGLPLHVVRRKDQGKSYRYLEENQKAQTDAFLAPPTHVLVFEPPPYDT
jgi:hypothetical protein